MARGVVVVPVCFVSRCRQLAKCLVDVWGLQAVDGKLAVPDWSEFRHTITEIFTHILETERGGENATYIPILAEQDPDWFGVSICTVDGQRLDIGNTDVEFSIQSCVKPLTYAVAVEDLGMEAVHRHVGCEPSGLSFNAVALNKDNVPHNPMINAGAIATGSCIKSGVQMARRFKYFMDRLTSLAGGERIGFSEATYLCEQETSWRNNALMYLMEDAGVFPSATSPADALDFYTQCCSISVTTKAASVIAATLANGGVCPLTGSASAAWRGVQYCVSVCLARVVLICTSALSGCWY